MVVYDLGTSEEALLKACLKAKEVELQQVLEQDPDKRTREEAEYDLAHVRAMGTIMQRKSLQELCERCLSYFWEEYQMTGDFGDLLDDMEITQDELVRLFNAAGYED